MTTLVDLTAAALKLPDADRAALAETLWDSLPDEDRDEEFDPADYDPEYAAEIKRRVEAVRNGTAVLIPWEQVHANLMADALEDADENDSDTRP